MTNPTHPNVPHVARQIGFDELVHNGHGPHEARQIVIKTPQAYEAWIAACDGEHDAFPRDIDFGEHMVLAIALGKQPAAEYGVRISTIDEIVGGFVGVQWQVSYRVETDVEAGAATPSYPQVVIRTERFPGPVGFRLHGDDAQSADRFV